MSELQPRPYRLSNQIMPYEWGTRGEQAFIPRLLGIKPEPGKPYAELWIGAHPKAPSAVVLPGGREVSLIELLEQHPLDVLGERVNALYKGCFPFLLKVLSAEEALSIQAHPNREQAVRLHAQAPQHYPDASHKPEIAITLDSLDALVGFRSLPEIAAALERYPELAGFVGEPVTQELAAHRLAPEAEWGSLLRQVYSRLMLRSVQEPQALAQALEGLRLRLLKAPALDPQERLFVDLWVKYPGDVGLFSLFLLKRVQFGPGQAVFTGAGVAHAYIHGNIIECMACSDNVVRAGLTPKYKDVQTLVEIIDYGAAPLLMLDASPSGFETIYRTPAEEFQVSRIELPPGRLLDQTGYEAPVALIVTRGEVQVHWDLGTLRFRKGESALIPANLKSFRLETLGGAQVFKATVPVEEAEI